MTPGAAYDPTLDTYRGIQVVTYDALSTEQGKAMSFAYLGIPENGEASLTATSSFVVCARGLNEQHKYLYSL